MVLYVLIFLSGFSLDGPKSPLELGPLPESGELFITSPSDLVIDEKGWFYLLDQGLKRILIWNEAGQFQKTAGRPGQGPGEFSFMDHRGHPHRPTVYKTEDQWFIYDDNNRSISTFDKNWTYQQRENLEIKGGIPNWIETITANRRLAQLYRREEKGSSYLLTLLDKGGETVKILNTISNPPRGERPVFRAFRATLVGHYHDLAKQVIAGHGGEPQFGIYNLDGALVRSIQVPLPRAEVTSNERKIYRERNQQNLGEAKLVFPEEHPLYQNVLPIGNKGFLVYRRDYESGALVGHLLDTEGNPKGPYSLELGEDGFLFGSRGRLVAVTVDEEGEFYLREVIPNRP